MGEMERENEERDEKRAETMISSMDTASPGVGFDA
jgi:hypothetical protein